MESLHVYVSIVDENELHPAWRRETRTNAANSIDSVLLEWELVWDEMRGRIGASRLVMVCKMVHGLLVIVHRYIMERLFSISVT